MRTKPVLLATLVLAAGLAVPAWFAAPASASAPGLAAREAVPVVITGAQLPTACLDDGTGPDPVPRPWPGEASTDPRVRAGYEQENGGTPYGQLRCDQRQGAWGSVGVHFLFTGDTDNGFGPKPTTEVDAQQWIFPVPTAAPQPVGEPSADAVRAPLVVTATMQSNRSLRGATIGGSARTGAHGGGPS